MSNQFQIYRKHSWGECDLFFLSNSSVIIELIFKMILQVLEHVFYSGWSLLIIILSIFWFRALVICPAESLVLFIKILFIFDGAETWILPWQQCHQYASCHSCIVCFFFPPNISWFEGQGNRFEMILQDFWGDWIRLVPAPGDSCTLCLWWDSSCQGETRHA